ncbi:MAG: HD domain-containing protein [Lachnospiraceae bacterium]|nr:HD domain-containing protein [Lachnospiraceae bacterium]
MQHEKTLIQHGDVTVYDHSLLVAEKCLALAERWPRKVNRRSLVRGALLHDYFLYDWHEDDPSHRLHGFTHAGRALRNAKRDFTISDTEADMIACHMFPLNLRVPRTREGRILCVVDKACATYETVRGFALAVKRRLAFRETR